MTDREKQIAGMEAVLFNYQSNVCRPCGSEQTCKNLGYGECGIFQSMATDLYEAGYRKMDEVTLKLDLGDRTPEEIDLIAKQFSQVMSTTPTALVSFSDEEIKKRVAKEIFEELRANEEANPEDCDCWLVAVEGEKFIKIAKKYGVEIKV